MYVLEPQSVVDAYNANIESIIDQIEPAKQGPGARHTRHTRYSTQTRHTRHTRHNRCIRQGAQDKPWVGSAQPRKCTS